VQRGCGRADSRQNDIRADGNQFLRIFEQTRGVADAPAIIDPQVAPDRPTGFF